MRIVPLLGALGLVACGPEKIGLGGGDPPDARLYADVYTWECEDSTTLDLYEGVFAYEISMEYAPDGLADRDLPSSGCTRGLDMFPADAGSGGTDLPDTDRPTWSTGDLEGALSHKATGFYKDDVFDNQSSCTAAEDLLADGTTLGDAGVFSGASAPVPGAVGEVTIDGEVDEETGIPFGAQITASWDASGWDRAWVQVRREKDGALVDSVTCATDGESFTLDDDAWSLLNEALQVDLTNLYVAFEVEGGSTTTDGQQILTYTRAMHVAVVQD
jgi:hypothetical protein